jgi:hypothetical protein
MEDERQRFATLVKAIDPLFKRGDLERFRPQLDRLMAVGPEQIDLWRKKSHYLVSLALRSMRRDDLTSAESFLDLADRTVPPESLSPYFVRERDEMRRRVREAEERSHASRA